MQGIAAPSSSKLLPDLLPQEKGTFTLVLDLNETLVYSDWKVITMLILCLAQDGFFSQGELVPRLFISGLTHVLS